MTRSASLVLFFSLLSFCTLYGHELPPVREFPVNGEYPVDELRVFPNPSNTGKFTLTFQLNKKNIELTIKVHDLIGNVVFHKQVGGLTYTFEDTIDLSVVPKGVYLLVITDGERKEIRRLSHT
ncbi:MAG: T9SS type A sorting domain-containing protein [Bacteroidota bacterium]